MCYHRLNNSKVCIIDTTNNNVWEEFIQDANKPSLKIYNMYQFVKYVEV